MIAAVKGERAPGFSFKEVKEPVIGDNEVLVRSKTVSICGTDLSIYLWNEWAQGRIKKVPLTMGHEFAGEIVEVGKNVSNLEVGDLISAETHIFCNECYECKHNRRHICENLEILGVDRDGCFTEYLALPAQNAWKNDKSLPEDLLSVQEPLGNAVDTVLTGGGVEGKDVAVFGCGPLGLMMIAVAKACGASNIFASDSSEYRLKIARALGARTINVMEEKETDVITKGVDVVCEASGSEKALKNALKVLHPGGRLSLLGLFHEPVAVNLTDDVIFKGIEIHGITGRHIYETWYTVASLLPKLNLKPIITHKLKLSDLDKGFELMKNKECGKVVLEV
jgi:threonine 3-dehydrogenase